MIFMFIQKKRNEYFAEKDAIYRHYVELHPEDFQEPGKTFTNYSPTTKANQAFFINMVNWR